MIATIAIAVLAVAALIYVAAPLRRGPRFEVDTGPTPQEEARDDKVVALAAIVDLEQERDAGKLSADDFAFLRGEYERDALEALRKLDATGETSLDDELEREIAAARQRLACPSCGAPRDAGTPCARCGA